MSIPDIGVARPSQASIRINVDDIVLGAPPRRGFATEVSAPPDGSTGRDFWLDFGCTHASDGKYSLAPGAIALCAADERTPAAALTDLMKGLSAMPHIAMSHGNRRQALYRLSEPALQDALLKKLPEHVSLVRSNELIALPKGWAADDGRATTVAGLTELTAADVANVGKPQPDPVSTSNPLLPFSLRGQSEKFKQMAIEARPLLGEVCLRGQVTIWYAAPGTGKTLVALSLLLDAVRDGRIAAGNIFYVNADDNGQGFATKLQILDDIGGNTLSPSIKGFRASEFTALLHKTADQNEARGILVIIDTLKKFVNIMDKRDASEFAQACRRIAMMGGTVLGLAHTTKNENSDGSPRYAGTSDLVDDADAAYTLKLLKGGMVTEKVVQFRCIKSRGDCAETAAYSFASEKGLGYEGMLASVRAVEPEQIDEFERVEAEQSDAEIIDTVVTCLGEGINTKMLLMKEVASRANISGRAACRLIEAYTGEDPARHRWHFRRAERGAQVFELIERPPAPG